MWIHAAVFGLGALTWTALEYLIHRFAGHVWTNNPFGWEHQLHHRDPRYFAPAVKKLGMAVVVLGAITLLGTPMLGAGLALAYSGGIVAAWLTYEWFHRQLHVSAPRSRFGRWARRHHLAHHFRDPRFNFGVTSAVWDRVAGTLRPCERVRIPRSQAPDWLLGPEGSGPGGEPWRVDYEVVGAPEPTKPLVH